MALSRKKLSRMGFGLSRHPFLDGVASIFDFTGVLHRPVRTVPSEMAESYAMWAAWASVGDAMREVMDEYPPERLIAEDMREASAD